MTDGNRQSKQQKNGRMGGLPRKNCIEHALRSNQVNSVVQDMWTTPLLRTVLPLQGNEQQKGQPGVPGQQCSPRVEQPNWKKSINVTSFGTYFAIRTVP